MRQLPVVLVTRDPALTGQIRSLADAVGCRVEVVATVAARHVATPMAGRLFVGADVVGAAGLPDDAPVLALDRHEVPSGRPAWVLPLDRDEVSRALNLLAVPPPAVPVVALVGAAGGVGTSTIAAGVAAALLPAAGPAGVALLDLTGVPEPVDPAGEATGPVVRSRQGGLTVLEAGVDRVDTALRRACEHGAVVVVDLPRASASWLECADGAVVVTLNRAGSLRNARRLLAVAQEHGAPPLLALATVPGGWWPADVASALGHEPTVLWPTDRRLARAEDRGDGREPSLRGRLREACLTLAEAALTRPVPAGRP